MWSLFILRNFGPPIQWIQNREMIYWKNTRDLLFQNINHPLNPTMILRSYLTWSPFKSLSNAATSYYNETFLQDSVTFQFRSWLSREWYSLLLTTTKTNINIISNDNNNSKTTHSGLQIDALENSDVQNNSVTKEPMSSTLIIKRNWYPV